MAMSKLLIALILAGVYLLYMIATKYREIYHSRKQLGKSVAIVEVSKATVASTANPSERYPKDIMKVGGRALGGQPEFYNEVDHSRGRFLGWVQTPEDRADERKMLNGFFRARIRKDVTYFWFIKGSKEELTPCVFRPGLDAISRGPGEAEGVPPEGIVIFKRSMNGMLLNNSGAERYRQLVLDEKHKNSIMADMLINVRDKERFTASGDMTKSLTEEMENKMKRSKRVHDVSSGRSGMPMGSPYGTEMYGDEAGAGGPQQDNMWRFEG